MTRKNIITSFFRVCLKIALCIVLILLIVACLPCQRQPKIQRGTILPTPFDNVIPHCKDCITNATWDYDYDYYVSGKVGSVPLYIEDYGFLAGGVSLNIEDNYVKDKIVAKYERHCDGAYYLGMTIREFTSDYDAHTYIEYVRKELQEGNFTAVTQVINEIPWEIESIPDDFFMYWYDEEPSCDDYYGDYRCPSSSPGDFGQSTWFRAGCYVGTYNMGINFDSACDYIAWLRATGGTCNSCFLDIYPTVNETILRLRSEVQ